MARLYDRAAISAAAAAWLRGPGARLLQLRSSQLAQVRPLLRGASTPDELAATLRHELSNNARRFKGQSPWSQAAPPAPNLLESLISSMLEAAHTSLEGPDTDRERYEVIRQHLRDTLLPGQYAMLEGSLLVMASTDFVDDVLRLHQAQPH